tara:strand:+ start:444 stop:662 length:219 start_codon:yes stop_codon:yes gene_type:complete
MMTDLIYLGGYGQFVWPAFIFTFLSCFFLYVKTKRELQEQEKIYMNEFKKLRTLEIKTVEAKKEKKEVLSGI